LPELSAGCLKVSRTEPDMTSGLSSHLCQRNLDPGRVTCKSTALLSDGDRGGALSFAGVYSMLLM